MTNKPSAFLLMPFDDDTIYTRFIKPLLEEAGFDVDRADDIDSQQNILKDILESIHKSDLIVADLTGSNPNVFYELGLAHALRKPVILLTQVIDEVPFDLKSYRLLEYSTHFAHIDQAKGKLTDYARKFLNGTLPFGSPVTDFAQVEPVSERSTDVTIPGTAQEDDRGVLDHLTDLNDGYGRIAEIVEGVSADLHVLTQSIGHATEELTQISANPSASSPAAAQRVCRRLAEQIAHFSSQLKKANAEYSDIAQNTEDSLESVVSFQLAQSDVTSPEVQEQLTSLRLFQSSTIRARDSQLDLATKMDTLPRLERRLNREVARGSEELRVMANNLDKTIASISRALEKHA